MIRTVRSNGLHIICLEHGKANALDVELLGELREEFTDAEDARAVILTGTGSIFCAGVDLYQITEAGADYIEQFVPLLSDVFEQLFELPTPVIAAVNGHALAGGAIMALAADYRLMAAGPFKFGIPELVVGVPFPTVPLEIVRHAVAANQLEALVYTGKTLLPDEALAQGLIHEVLDSNLLLSRAQEVAQQFAGYDAAVFHAAKLGLRSDALERMKRERGRTDADRLATWSSPATHDRIRAYLASLHRK
jgi:enoyl-CoA hydratase